MRREGQQKAVERCCRSRPREPERWGLEKARKMWQATRSARGSLRAEAECRCQLRTTAVQLEWCWAPRCQKESGRWQRRELKAKPKMLAVRSPKTGAKRQWT